MEGWPRLASSLYSGGLFVMSGQLTVTSPSSSAISLTMGIVKYKTVDRIISVYSSNLDIQKVTEQLFHHYQKN